MCYQEQQKRGVMLDDQELIKQRDPSGALTVSQMSYKQATFDPAIDGWPAWSPDGSQVVFVVMIIFSE